MPCPDHPQVVLPAITLDSHEIGWDDYIYFDLKTTGLRGRPDVIQIGAVSPSGEEFNRYVVPSQPIEEETAEMTGITYSDGVMRHNGYRIQGVPIEEALEEFIEFIDSQPTSLLAAHQAHGCHGFILQQVAQDQGCLRGMEEAVDGILDTLTVFNELYPDKLNSLQALMAGTLDGRTRRHHALKDARDLRTIMEQTEPHRDLLAKHTRDFYSM